MNTLASVTARQGLFLSALIVTLLVATASVAAVAEAPVGPDPVVEKWPDWPYQTTCGELEFDPVAAFGGLTDAERGARPSERALARLLKEQRSWAYPIVPAHHWRLLAETEDAAEFASGRLADPFGPGTVSVERQEGGWKAVGMGSNCEPTSIVDGLAAVTWTLAVDKPRPEPGDRHLWVNLGPGECSSGRSQNARARKPVLWRIDKKLMIAMTLKPLPPGGYTCQGLIEPPLKVRLPESLGESHLFDGATYPPHDVVREWSRERTARRRVARR
jgi:hypothetical protein